MENKYMTIRDRVKEVLEKKALEETAAREARIGDAVMKIPTLLLSCSFDPCTLYVEYSDGMIKISNSACEFLVHNLKGSDFEPLCEILTKVEKLIPSVSVSPERRSFKVQ